MKISGSAHESGCTVLGQKKIGGFTYGHGGHIGHETWFSYIPSENATEISLRFQCYFNEITVKSQ